ncbi:MAG: hypothetical protein IKL29_02435 [Bacteroidaceae bacterium]|nr:hypothetical protein [Bacteroidaceae bacterium]
MKKVLLLVALLFIVSAVKAQDLIVTKNAEEILAKVTAITTDTVTYKRWSNLEGPAYTTPKSTIFYIKYQNGEKDVFQEVATSTTRKLSGSNNLSTPIKFQGYITAGTIFTSVSAGPTLDVSMGMKIYEHFYIGVETGFHSMLTPLNYYYTHTDGSIHHVTGAAFEGYVPIGVNMKGYFTKNRKVNPYINCSLGGFIGIADLGGFNGFHCQVGAGFNVKRFTFGAGYSALVLGGTASCGYAKLGVRLGK